MPPTVINPTNKGTVKFGLTEQALTDYACQVSRCELIPTPNLVQRPGTFCAAPGQVPGASSWAVGLDFLQDYGAASSLAEFAFDNDGALVFFAYEPDDPAVKGIKGQCYVTAGNYGGPAGDVWQASVTWQCPTRPTLVPPVAARTVKG
jgi:hypothetical protein